MSESAHGRVEGLLHVGRRSSLLGISNNEARFSKDVARLTAEGGRPVG
jgi:hypothetical protein